MRVLESENGGTTRAVTSGIGPEYRDGLDFSCLGFTSYYATAAGFAGAAFAPLAPLPLRFGSSATAATGLVATSALGSYSMTSSRTLVGALLIVTAFFAFALG